MQLLGSLVRHRWLLLLLPALVLTGCATGRHARATAAKRPAVVQEIPSYGGTRRVAISVSEQKLRAYDGGRLVFETRVSTGMEGKRTPTGSFRAHSKDLIHYSSRYDNAPMPFSVQFHGNYFIHGFSVVPDYPASHGCIRLPLREDGHCPAEEFYDWVRIGTPIRVAGS